jgi:hypothetical protein
MSPKRGNLDRSVPAKAIAVAGVLPIMMPQPVDGSKAEKRGQSVFLSWPASNWIASFLIHMVLLFIMTLIVRVVPAIDKMVLTLPLPVKEVAVEEELEQFVDFETPEFEMDPIEDVVEIENLFRAIDIMQLDVLDEADAIAALVDPMDRLAVASRTGEPIRLLPATISVEHQGGSDASGKTGEAGGSGSVGHGIRGEFGGRASRRILFTTPEMAYAIDEGLIWLARHQLADGGWSFDHRVGDCQGRCPNPGSKRSARVAATGLALLPFLGAGHSPDHGKYRQTVSAGINFLISNTASNGSLWRTEGQMYGHGIATLALCECYGILSEAAPSGARNAKPMERDAAYEELTNNRQDELVKRWGSVDVEKLKRTATAAASFIVSAQAIDGGWRYQPGELGDISVVGWQIMALKSARDAGLGMNKLTIAAASQFLDSVQMSASGDGLYGVVGTRYAYKPDKKRSSEATTAIGLACRICMGTSPFHPGMEIAVKRIASRGPLGGDMYYNFYANQVVFQHGGAEWQKWSQKLNRGLIRLQNRKGHLEGSWYFGDRDHGGDRGGAAGGRLYTTAMACLCLEESFRHLPMFRGSAQRQFIERLRAAAPVLPDDEEAEAADKQPDADEFPLGDSEFAKTDL